MPCYSPLTAYYSRDIGKSGRRGITFNHSASHSGVALKLPCGQCIGCRLERSRQWAMRCVHESKMHAFNHFVTLTYNNESLPEYGTLRMRDLQLFNKRVRKLIGPFRFYAAGEYGDKEGRPHYHSIMFGLHLRDLRLHSRSKTGDLYTSRRLTEIWGNGHVVIAEVNFDTCAYVARYVVDKITGEDAVSHYRRLLPDGSYVGIAPEFNIMSRRPGIGSSYYEKFGREIIAHDTVIMNGREVAPPRFYDTRMPEEHLAYVKRNRRRKALVHRADQSPDRRRVRRAVTLATLNQKRRPL